MICVKIFISLVVLVIVVNSSTGYSIVRARGGLIRTDHFKGGRVSKATFHPRFRGYPKKRTFRPRTHHVRKVVHRPRINYVRKMVHRPRIHNVRRIVHHPNRHQVRKVYRKPHVVKTTRKIVHKPRVFHHVKKAAPKTRVVQHVKKVVSSPPVVHRVIKDEPQTVIVQHVQEVAPPPVIIHKVEEVASPEIIEVEQVVVQPQVVQQVQKVGPPQQVAPAGRIVLQSQPGSHIQTGVPLPNGGRGHQLSAPVSLPSSANPNIGTTIIRVERPSNELFDDRSLEVFD